MLLADLRAAEHHAPAAGLIDQFPRLVTARKFGGRVLERAAAGLAAQWLASLARGGDAVHFGLDGCGLARHAPEARRDDDCAFGQRRVAIAVGHVGQRHVNELAIVEHDIAIDEDVIDLAAIGAAVHAAETADRARDRAEKFEARNTQIARSGRDENAARSAAAGQRGFVEPLDRCKRLAQPHDHARHPAIAHNEIGAEPQRHDRHFGIEFGQERLKVFEIGRLEQPIRRAAGFEPD